MAELEILADDGNLCGEAPIWDVEQKRIVWTDIESGFVYELNAAGEKSIINKDQTINGIGLNHDGRLVFSGADGLLVWRGQNDYETVFSDHDGEAVPFNDMIVGPRGSVYAGSHYWGENGMEKEGALFHIDVDGSAKVVAEGIVLANGLGFSPDNRTLYFTDCGSRKIYAFDVDEQSGDLSNQRLFVTVPRDEGIPDGMTVDSEGFVWSAQWFGEQVVRYDPDGVVERHIKMPMKQISCVAFGGADLTDLYISSAGLNFESELAPPGYDFKAPNIGGPLYKLKVEVQGKLEHRARFG